MKSIKAEKFVLTSSEKYTNISVIQSIVVGIIAGSLFVSLSIMLKGISPHFYDLINERGVIQYLTVYMFWFSVGMLVFKFRAIQREERAFGLPYIQSFATGFDVAGGKTMLAQQVMIEEDIDVKEKNLLLVNRINKALKQIKLNNSPSEVANVLNRVSETDSAVIDSSYVLVTFMVWIIPITGFIGTIVGMTTSIGAFDTVLQGIKDSGFQIVSENLGQVTDGLAVAFETTFLALVFSAILNFFANILQRREENLLSDVDDFTTEHIVNKFSAVKGRIKDSIEKVPPETLPKSGDVDFKEMTESLGKKLKDFAEPLVMELKNFNKANQVNAQHLQAQMGKVVEAISNRKGGGIDQPSQHSIEGSDLAGTIEGLIRQIQRNNELLEKIPGPIEEMIKINKKLGELYGKIYNKSFSE